MDSLLPHSRHVATIIVTSCIMLTLKLMATKQPSAILILGTLFLGEIIFNGTIVELEPAAFETYFSAEHIQSARERGGYWPVMRNALKSNRVHYEVVEGRGNG